MIVVDNFGTGPTLEYGSYMARFVVQLYTLHGVVWPGVLNPVWYAVMLWL